MSARLRPGRGPLSDEDLERLRERLDAAGLLTPNYGEPLSAKYQARRAARREALRVRALGRRAS